MPLFTLGDIAQVVGGALCPSCNSHLKAIAGARGVSGVSTDSRSIKNGDFFVAIAGEKFDGHDYVVDVLKAGAAGAMISHRWYWEHAAMLPISAPLVVVEHVLDALQALAGWYRQRFDLPLIGITGSNGKTTTKDMIAEVLGRRYRILKTPGNLNSQVGVPQVLFQLKHDHDVAVLELGMNHAGELDRLARMVRPKVGVITNVGPVHLEYLETLEGVARAKGELLDALPDDGIAVLNADDPHVMAQRSRTRAHLMTFGHKDGAEVRVRDIETQLSGTTFRLDDGSTFRLNIAGEHQVSNALAAIAVGRLMGIKNEDIHTALASLTPASMRMDVRMIGKLLLINDTYNANPVSTCAALHTLASASRGRRIAVLGDMLELGRESESAHRQVGQAVVNTADLLITVGERARSIADGARNAGMAEECVVVCASNRQAGDCIIESADDGDVILIKGSRGMKMEEIVADLEMNFGSMAKPQHT